MQTNTKTQKTNVAKRVPKAAKKDPQILKNPKKSPKVLPKCPLGRYLAQLPKKQQKIMILGYPEPLKIELALKREHDFHFLHATRKRYPKDLPKSDLFVPFGPPEG